MGLRIPGVDWIKFEIPSSCEVMMGKLFALAEAHHCFVAWIVGFWVRTLFSGANGFREEAAGNFTKKMLYFSVFGFQLIWNLEEVFG